MSTYLFAPLRNGAADWVAAHTITLPGFTPTQIRILAFIRRYQQMWGETPLYREIAHGCGLRSDSAVAHQIQRLVALGALRKPPRLVRAVHLNVVLAVRVA